MKINRTRRFGLLTLLILFGLVLAGCDMIMGVAEEEQSNSQNDQDDQDGQDGQDDQDDGSGDADTDDAPTFEIAVLGEYSATEWGFTAATSFEVSAGNGARGLVAVTDTQLSVIRFDEAGAYVGTDLIDELPESVSSANLVGASPTYIAVESGSADSNEDEIFGSIIHIYKGALGTGYAPYASVNMEFASNGEFVDRSVSARKILIDDDDSRIHVLFLDDEYGWATLTDNGGGSITPYAVSGGERFGEGYVEWHDSLDRDDIAVGRLIGGPSAYALDSVRDRLTIGHPSRTATGSGAIILVSSYPGGGGTVYDFGNSNLGSAGFGAHVFVDEASGATYASVNSAAGQGMYVYTDSVLDGIFVNTGRMLRHGEAVLHNGYLVHDEFLMRAYRSSDGELSNWSLEYLEVDVRGQFGTLVSLGDVLLGISGTTFRTIAVSG